MTSNTIYSYTPYTYLIGWSQLNKWYYGRRTAKHCHPDEFWVSYFTSSKEVRKFRKEHGDPDIIQIRKTFKNSKDCSKWEHLVLKRLNAKYRSEFLNLAHADGKFDCTNMHAAIHSITQEKLGLINLDDPRWVTGEIISANKNKPHKDAGLGFGAWNSGKTKETDIRVKKVSEKLTGKPGHPSSEKQKEAVSKAWKGVKRGHQTAEHKEKVIASRIANGNNNHREETKLKMSITRTGNKRINNGKVNKRAKGDKLTKMLNEGWIYGWI